MVGAASDAAVAGAASDAAVGLRPRDRVSYVIVCVVVIVVVVVVVIVVTSSSSRSSTAWPSRARITGRAMRSYRNQHLLRTSRALRAPRPDAAAAHGESPFRVRRFAPRYWGTTCPRCPLPEVAVHVHVDIGGEERTCCGVCVSLSTAAVGSGNAVAVVHYLN